MRTRPSLVMAVEMESQARCANRLHVVVLGSRGGSCGGAALSASGLAQSPPPQNFSVAARSVLFGRVEMRMAECVSWTMSFERRRKDV